jgi:hypothetical protein
MMGKRLPFTYLGGPHERWGCIEPDGELAASIASDPELKNCELIVGTVADVPASRRFNGQSPDPFKIWDRLLVPVSSCLDPLLGYKAGKSIIAVRRMLL